VISKQVAKIFLILVLLCGVSSKIFSETIDNPCEGLLNIVDRSTVGDSVCVVPFKNAVLEAGYQYQKLTQAAGHQQNFPEAEFRLGLPANNEFFLLLPNYILQSMTPHAGYTATTAGIKHQLGYTQDWVVTVEGLLTFPDGSAAFGSQGLGAALNGIVSYDFNPAFNMVFMLGGSTATQPNMAGGQRFNSINPDIVFTYSPIPKANFFAEVYGQSKTGPGNGSGFNCDGGVMYLLLPRLVMDLEVGQRIGGSLDNFENYVGAGGAIEF
jgi:hypothetical protein